MHERGYDPDVVHRTDDNGTLYGLIAGGSRRGGRHAAGRRRCQGSVATLQIEEPLPPRRVALARRRGPRVPTEARGVPGARPYLVCRDLGLEPTAAGGCLEKKKKKIEGW